jgi:hypothetical protein
MGVSSSTPAIDVSQKSLLLMTMTLSHRNSTERAPKLAVLYIERPDAQSKADRQNFIPDGTGRIVDGAATTYDLRMAILPGAYEIVSAGGFIRVFPFIAQIMIPLQFDLHVPTDSVVYLGHIDADLRPMKQGEFRAGPLLPLIDQAAMGVSDGTFDVTVSDQSATDIPQFRAAFPALRSANIRLQILPPFDEAKAYAWWNAH